MISFKKPACKWVALASVNVMMISGIILAKSHFSNTPNDNDIISTRLNDIQSQLINLQQEIGKPSAKINVNAFNEDFNKLANLIEQLKSKDESQLNQLITENRTELTQKLDVIHDVINKLDSKQHSVKYLPSTALPFKILSIDSIQQVSVVTVTYDFKTIPLEKNDRLAGWTISQIDFGKQRVELENTSKERVIAALETEQGKQNV